MSDQGKLGLRDQALLLALGLGGEETRDLESAVAGGDRRAMRELDEAADAAACLALNATPVTPPATLKNRLLDRVSHEHSPGLGVVRKDEGAWRESGVPGVTFKVLYKDKKANLVTQLVRMEPGAHYPAHMHAHDEQCLILQGDLRHNGHVYTAGDFTWAEADTVDPELHTVDGNLLLIIASPENKAIVM